MRVNESVTFKYCIKKLKNLNYVILYKFAFYGKLVT